MIDQLRQTVNENLNTTITGIATAFVQVLLWALGQFLGIHVPPETQISFLTIGVFIGLMLSKDGRKKELISDNKPPQAGTPNV